MEVEGNIMNQKDNSYFPTVTHSHIFPYRILLFYPKKNLKEGEIGTNLQVI